MSDSDSKSRSVIPASEAEAFSSWRMPEMTVAERQKLVSLARRVKRPSLDSEPVELIEEPLHAEKMTVAEWEVIRDEGYQDGFQQGKKEGIEAGRKEGVEQGMEEGLVSAQAQIDTQLEEIKVLMASLQRPIADQEQALHELIMKLVFKLSRAMVVAEFTLNPELLLDLVRKAMTLMPPTEMTPVLSLHPDDCKLITRLADREGWTLKENPSAERGDLRVVAGSCVLDLDLDQRFDQVAGELQKKILERSDDVSS